MNSKSKNTLYLQTTGVAAEKSLGEITAVLVKNGARTIQTLYSEAGQPSGLEWSMVLYNRPVFFRLPVKTEPVYKVLRKRAGYVSATRDGQLRAQADRIAWRQMLAWVRLQMALVELGMVEYAQVFLPYVTGENGKTMWEAASETHFRQLEAANAVMVPTP